LFTFHVSQILFLKIHHPLPASQKHHCKSKFPIGKVFDLFGFQFGICFDFYEEVKIKTLEGKTPIFFLNVFLIKLFLKV